MGGQIHRSDSEGNERGLAALQDTRRLIWIVAGGLRSGRPPSPVAGPVLDVAVLRIDGRL